MNDPFFKNYPVHLFIKDAESLKMFIEVNII